jgi:hypothetical protein
MLCWLTDFLNIFGLAQGWRRSLKARAQIADHFRRNSFACGNLMFPAPYFRIFQWRHSVSCSSALPEACWLTCPLVRPWRDHRLLHADRQTEVNNFSLQWRQHCDKIAGTDFMGLSTWDYILWNQEECLLNLRLCSNVDQDAKPLGVRPSRLVNNCRRFGEQCCLLFMV